MRHVATFVVFMKLSAMLFTGAFTGCKPICRANRHVCSAVYAEPLSPLPRLSRQLITEALLHAFHHQVADIIATAPGRACNPADGFAITVIQGEGTPSLAPRNESQSRPSINAYCWFPRQYDHDPRADAAPYFGRYLDSNRQLRMRHTEIFADQ